MSLSSTMESLKPEGLDTIPKRLKHLADTYPDREIFICVSQGSRDAFTASSLLKSAGLFAAKLLKQGFKRGDVIANTLPNSPERLITDLAIILAGCVGMNGQILLADGSDFLCSAWKARCNGIILCPEEWSAAWKLFQTHITDQSADIFSPMSHNEVPDLTTAVLVRPRKTNYQLSFLHLLEMSTDIAPPIDLCQPDDVLYVLTTSGSSGYSKLIPHTHAEAIEIGSSFIKKSNSLANKTKEFSARPLGWVGGYPFKNYVAGEVRVLVDTIATRGRCGVPEILDGVTREECSVGFIMPMEVEALLAQLTPEEIQSFRLKAIITGGQPIKRRQVARALLLADRVMVGYAGSESGLIAAHMYEDANSFEDFCAGKPVERTSVKVVYDNDEECPPGVVGKMLIKGPRVFTGFFNRQETPDPTTAQAFTLDGWYRTDDFGWFNADGTLYALGRAKDVISRDGIHLYPGWLEAKIIQHQDVLEAVILPVSDQDQYHKICVIVKTRSDSDLTREELESFCRSMFLANTKDNYVPMPDFFKILKGADFPETATGKPNLHELRNMAEDAFGVNELAPHHLTK